MNYFVAAPGWVYSGGPEALHQLEHALRENGFEARMLYYGPTDVRVQKDFIRRYGTVQAGDEDMVDPEGVLILPEVESPAKWRDKGWRRIAVWWLSGQRLHPLKEYEGCAHFFQSHYAQTKLAQIGFRGEMLTDYIRDDLVERSAEIRNQGKERQPRIAFNHRTAGLVSAWRAAGCDLNFTMIDGLVPLDALEEMARCRVFLDLGWHPGRDRMPREAALAGCVVVVNQEGSAGDKRDMPLPVSLRLRNPSQEELVERLRGIIASEESMGMADYRDWVEGQKNVFKGEAAKVGQLLADSQFYQISRLPTVEDMDEFCIMDETSLEATRGQLAELGRVWFKVEEPPRMRIFLLKAKHWLVGKVLSLLAAKRGRRRH